jgi:hypothetical protein
MKKNVLLSALLILWAISAKALDLPPYSEGYNLTAFFSYEPVQNMSGIVMFPNPVTEGRLTIKSEDPFNTIQILNITGEIVFSQEYPSGSYSEVLELNKLEKGMYLVRIGFTGRTNFTGKIIVK